MAVQTNGYSNLTPNVKPGLANGHTKAPQFSKPAVPKKSGNVFKTLFGFFARIAIWYSLYTVVARCPSSSSKLTPSSPQICKPYLTARSYIDPHVLPFYKTYAEPYVEKARPYVQKIDKQYVGPVVDLSKQTYDAYGAPQVQKAQVIGRKQWDKNVKPQLDVVEKNVKATYDANVAPHLKVASEAATPYYTKSRDGVLSAYKQQILPTALFILPYAQQAYDYVYGFALDTAVPYAEWVWAEISNWLARSALPKVKILYGENVEPQLVRISERLGRYTDKRKLKSAVKAAGTTEAEPEANPDAVNQSDAPDPNSEEVFQKIMDDLRVWQDKFAVAADKGSEDLNERIKEITDKQISSQAESVGKSLIISLKEATKAAETTVKDTILKIVKSLPEEPSAADIESANGQLFAAVRSAGLSVKSQAEDLTTWKQNYDAETLKLVNAALDSTLDVIDNLRDLGLQELGMRWAWTDGVTYKHWAKFHELKKALEDWRTEIAEVAAAHDGLNAAKAAGNDLQTQSMAIAETTAKELARLKEVGQWKIKALDTSDDFSNKYAPAAAIRGSQKILKDAKNAVGAQKEQAESIVNEVSSGASSIASSLSKSVVGSTGSAESIATKISAAVVGSSSNIVDSASSVVSSAGSVAASAASEAASSASSVIAGEPSAFTDKVASSVSSVASEATESASSAGKKVWGGAMAANVEAREIVYDDDDSLAHKVERVAESLGEQWSEATDSIADKFKASTPGTVESITSQAGSYAAAATDAASENYESLKSLISELVSGKEPDFTESVLSRFSSLYTKGIPAYYASATSAAGEAYDSAASVAASVFTPPPALESILAAVSSQIDAAVDGVSVQIYGTSKGPAEKAASAASGAYDSAASAASEAYDAASSVASDVYGSATSAAAGAYDSVQSYASEAVYGTPTGYVEAASSSVADLAASASTALSIAIYGTPKGYVEQATSAAASQYQEAASVAADTFESLSSVASENAAAAQKVIQDNASVASSVLSENYEAGSSVVASRASDAASVVGGAYSAASAKASEAIYGPELSAWESVQSRLHAAVETAQAKLSAIATEVGAGASGAAEKAKENLESLKEQISEAVLPEPTPSGPVEKVTKYLKKVKEDL